MRKYVLYVLLLILFFILVYIINETPIIYSEKEEYKLPSSSSLFSPEANEIFINQPESETAIIFYHGYKATPQEWKYIALKFSDIYTIAVPLYPGHGTSEKDFQRSCFSQWYSYAKRIYVKYRKKYKRVYLCGNSMGGTIALRLAEEFSDNKQLSPDGVVSVAAPVFLNNLIPAGILYDWRLYFSRILSWVIKEVDEKVEEVEEDGASWIGYKGKIFPVQVHSLKMGLYETRRNLSKINIPLLLIHSKADKTVPFENLVYIAKNVSSTHIQIRIFDLRKFNHTRHKLILYNTTKDIVAKEIKKFIETP